MSEVPLYSNRLPQVHSGKSLDFFSQSAVLRRGSSGAKPAWVGYRSGPGQLRVVGLWFGKHLKAPPCLREAIDDMSSTGTRSWFFMPCSTACSTRSSSLAGNTCSATAIGRQEAGCAGLRSVCPTRIPGRELSNGADERQILGELNVVSGQG